MQVAIQLKYQWISRLKNKFSAPAILILGIILSKQVFAYEMFNEGAEVFFSKSVLVKSVKTLSGAPVRPLLLTSPYGFSEAIYYDVSQNHGNKNHTVLSAIIRDLQVRRGRVGQSGVPFSMPGGYLIKLPTSVNLTICNNTPDCRGGKTFGFSLSKESVQEPFYFLSMLPAKNFVRSVVPKTSIKNIVPEKEKNQMMPEGQGQRMLGGQPKLAQKQVDMVRDKSHDVLVQEYCSYGKAKCGLSSVTERIEIDLQDYELAFLLVAYEQTAKTLLQMSLNLHAIRSGDPLKTLNQLDLKGSINLPKLFARGNVESRNRTWEHYFGRTLPTFELSESTREALHLFSKMSSEDRVDRLWELFGKEKSIGIWLKEYYTENSLLFQAAVDDGSVLAAYLRSQIQNRRASFIKWPELEDFYKIVDVDVAKILSFPHLIDQSGVSSFRDGHRFQTQGWPERSSSKFQKKSFRRLGPVKK